jgi:AraC-like DNA-binding protein
MSAEQAIQRSSTQAVPQRMRFDYWMSTLRQSLWPVSEWQVDDNFNFDLQEAALGCLTTIKETVSAHYSRRTRVDLDTSGDRCYLLFANQFPWQVAHNGREERILSGDCVLVDSQGELETNAASGFRGVILKLPVSWVHTWVPNPELLVGSRIGIDSRWGPVFSPIVSQFTPELAAAPPLPPGVLVDQLGAILGLIAGNAESRDTSDLLAKIQNCIRERCTEPQITAADVAESLNIPPRMLHRILAANNLTFAFQLLEARITIGLRMLTSRSCTHLTILEIARHSGFLSTPYFARVVRQRTGHTLPELRHPAQ